MKIKINKIYIPSDKVISRSIDKTLIIIPVEMNSNSIDFNEALYSLESIGIEIWNRLSDKIPVKTLCLELEKKYNASLETITNDVLELLTDLADKGLIIEQK